MGAGARGGRLDRHRLAQGGRRSWPRPVAPGRLRRRVRPGGRTGPAQPHERAARRPDAAGVRERGAATAVPSADPAGRGAVVPGVQRAGRRVGPGRALDAGGVRGRRVGADRPEGVDVAGPPGRLVLRPRPDGPGRAAPPRAELPAGADGPAGDRDPTDPPADRGCGVQRGLLRRGADVRRPRRRRSGAGLGGGDGHVGGRAWGVDARPAARLRQRVAADQGGGRRGPGGWPTRSSGTAWSTSTSGCGSCG